MMSKRNKEPHVKVDVDFYLINDVTFPQSRSVNVTLKRFVTDTYFSFSICLLWYEYRVRQESSLNNICPWRSLVPWWNPELRYRSV